MFVDPNLKGSVQELEEDSSFQAICTGTGNPPPNITWNFEPDEPNTEPQSSDETIDAAVVEKVKNGIPSNFNVDCKYIALTMH